MRRALLIANPSASGFTGAAFRRVLEILGRDFDVDVAWPQGPADTRARAMDAATSGLDVVFAMGGDGVAHHVANCLVDTSTAPPGRPTCSPGSSASPRGPRRQPS
jgi:diacylglycerol kinase family enzyme